MQIAVQEILQLKLRKLHERLVKFWKNGQEGAHYKAVSKEVASIQK